MRFDIDLNEKEFATGMKRVQSTLVWPNSPSNNSRLKALRVQQLVSFF